MATPFHFLSRYIQPNTAISHNYRAFGVLSFSRLHRCELSEDREALDVRLLAVLGLPEVVVGLCAEPSTCFADAGLSAQVWADRRVVQDAREGFVRVWWIAQSH
jgi:hypothetical protein